MVHMGKEDLKESSRRHFLPRQSDWKVSNWLGASKIWILNFFKNFDSKMYFLDLYSIRCIRADIRTALRKRRVSQEASLPMCTFGIPVSLTQEHHQIKLSGHQSTTKLHRFRCPLCVCSHRTRQHTIRPDDFDWNPNTLPFWSAHTACAGNCTLINQD